MNRYSLLLLLVFSFIFFSCEKFIEIELPDSEPLFVIHGTLEPGLPIHIMVSKTAGVLEDINYAKLVDGVWTANQFEIVKNAKVEIIVDGNTSYSLIYGENDVFGYELFLGSYTSKDLEIEVGRTYELIVSGSNMPTATSIATIPYPVDINIMSISKGEVDEWLKYPKVDYNIAFIDPAERNFYEIKVSIEEIETTLNYFGDTVITTYVHQNVYPEFKIPIYGENEGWNGGPQLYLNDKLFNGKEIELELTSYYPYYSGNYNLKVYLRHINEDWYKYESTAHRQRTNRADPFAQPLQVHSNIINGLGILKAGVATYYEVNVNWE